MIAEDILGWMTDGRIHHSGCLTEDIYLTEDISDGCPHMGAPWMNLSNAPLASRSLLGGILLMNSKLRWLMDQSGIMLGYRSINFDSQHV